MENQYKPAGATHREIAEADRIIEGVGRRSKVTDSIIKLFKDRDKLGFLKFNSSLEDSPRNNIQDRLTDAIEEACDLIQYLVCLQDLIKERKHLEENLKEILK